MKKATLVSGVLLRSPFPIALCTTEDQFKALLKRSKLPKEDWPQWMANDDDGRTHLLGGGGNQLCVVCIRKLKMFKAIGMINHETIHIWQFIKEYIDENKPGDEIEAYVLQNISQHLVEAYFQKS